MIYSEDKSHFVRGDNFGRNYTEIVKYLLRLVSYTQFPARWRTLQDVLGRTFVPVDLPRRLGEQLAGGELPDPDSESEESDSEQPAGSAGDQPKGDDRDATVTGGTSLLDVMLTPRSLAAKQQREGGSAGGKP